MEKLENISAAESDKAATIRTALARVPRLEFVAGSDVAAFLRRDIIRAGLDPLEVHEWIGSVGGYEGETYVRGARMTSARRDVRPPHTLEPYFAVPLAVLRAP